MSVWSCMVLPDIVQTVEFDGTILFVPPFHKRLGNDLVVVSVPPYCRRILWSKLGSKPYAISSWEPSDRGVSFWVVPTLILPVLSDSPKRRLRLERLHKISVQRAPSRTNEIPKYNTMVNAYSWSKGIYNPTQKSMISLIRILCHFQATILFSGF